MSQFVDECGLNVRGGDGGAGAVSFRREARVPKGGPDGGDGGNGGSVWLEADHNVASLLAFKDHPHRRAKNGTHGSGGRRHGRSADDLVLRVPEGTSVHSLYGSERLVDLLHHGDRYLVAQAGLGGKGNARFLSNSRRAPMFAEQGEEGEECWLRLELRLMADVALVGFPNVGKSTLISRISSARPRIADYPFTTLEPNLGVVRIDGLSEFVVADIPGLIEGAAEGKGLGYQFLRHIERARLLVMMLDLAPTAELSPDQQLHVLEKELMSYKPDLISRQRIVVGSRADIANQTVVFSGERISAVTGEGLENLLYKLSEAVESARKIPKGNPSVVIHRPEPEGVAVIRAEDGAWEISNRKIARVVNLNDLTNPDALDYIHSKLRKMGVDSALSRIGAKTGETVRIGRLEFDYEEEDL